MDSSPTAIAAERVPERASAPSTAFDPAAPVPEEYDVFCEGCGYSLVGLVGDRCPECGATFSAGELPFARVPWLHRRRIGTFRAYRQTVAQVVRHPGAFAAELCRPVRISADDAKRFRVRTVYFAATSAVGVALALLWISGELIQSWQRGPRAVSGIVVFLLTLWLASSLFLRLATDMPVFIWKGLPSLPPTELAPLHHYAAAPLALAPVVGLVAVVAPVLAWVSNIPAEWFYVLNVAAVIILVAWVIRCWMTPLVLMRRATGCGFGRVALLGLYLPVHWLLMAMLTLGMVMIVAIVYEELS